MSQQRSPRLKSCPDVIKSFTPAETLNLSFRDSVTASENVTVITGSLLTIDQTANEAHFTLGSEERLSGSARPDSINSSYIIVIFDPDAPAPQMPNVSQALHFIGGNFTTVNSSGTLSNSSAALVEYLSPSLPDDLNPHRYIALFYNQPHDFDTTGPIFSNASTPRLNFSVSDFARNAKLRSPIAGNFFLVGTSSSSNSCSGSAPSNTPNPAATANVTGTDFMKTQPTIANDLTSGFSSFTIISAPASGSVSAAISWKADAPIAALISALGAIVVRTIQLL